MRKHLIAAAIVLLLGLVAIFSVDDTERRMQDVSASGSAVLKSLATP